MERVTASHLDMVDLRLLVHVAETRSVRRGAERTYLSAPAASSRIKHLEEVTGTTLFERSSKGMTLTPAGNAFLFHARRMLAELEELGGELRAYASGISGHLRVLANPTAMAEYLPTFLSAFMDAHSETKIDLSERFSAEIVRLVGAGEADFGFVAGHVHAEGLELQDAGRIGLGLLVPRGHALAARPAVSLADTLEYEHIAFRETSPTFPVLNQMAALHRKPLKIRAQASTVDTLCRLVHAGLGIGVAPLPSGRRHARVNDVVLVPLADDNAYFTLHVCARRFAALPPLARELIDLFIAQGDGLALAA